MDWSAQACVSGMFELKEDSAFKAHLRDFLVQTKSFADKNNADLFAEEAAAQREVLPRQPTVFPVHVAGANTQCTISRRVEPAGQAYNGMRGVCSVPVVAVAGAWQT